MAFSARRDHCLALPLAYPSVSGPRAMRCADRIAVFTIDSATRPSVRLTMFDRFVTLQTIAQTIAHRGGVWLR